jgi:hypothetical protein
MFDSCQFCSSVGGWCQHPKSPKESRCKTLKTENTCPILLKSEPSALESALKSKLEPLINAKPVHDFPITPARAAPLRFPKPIQPSIPLEPEPSQSEPGELPLECQSALTHPKLELLRSRAFEFGPAFPTVLTLAWACVSLTDEVTTAKNPHFLSTLWTLAEMTGKCERTIQRHLFEEGHPWSQVVKEFFAFEHNLEQMSCYKNEKGETSRTVIAGTLIRFFKDTRYSKRAKITKFARRDLDLERESRRTQSTRLEFFQDRLARAKRDRLPDETETPETAVLNAHLETSQAKYLRAEGLMSWSIPAKAQVFRMNWQFTCLESLSRLQTLKTSEILDHDIPDRQLLEALLERLEFEEELARVIGSGVTKARSAWVFIAAKRISSLLRDRLEGWWRKALWVALRARLGGTEIGFRLLSRAFHLCLEARLEGGFLNPMAFALSQIRPQGWAEIERDYGRGGALAVTVGPKPAQFSSAMEMVTA